MDTAAAPAIRLEGVTKRFGRTTAVDQLDLTIEAGSVVALLGPNGAGKSTTTEMILGLQQPDAGTVEVLGQRPIEAVRTGRVGAMLQSGALLDDVSVARLLRLMHGLHAHPRPIADVVELADIAPILRTPVGKLSGGQSQRVRFAMALLADPDLILLDEPTVGLDVESRRGFWATMRRFADAGRTILFATHYLDEADAMADRVVVLASGRVVADGTGSEIKRAAGGRVVSFHPRRTTDWHALPGVTDVTETAERVSLSTTESDAVLREVLELDGSDIEVGSVGLEDAFVNLTSTHDGRAPEPDPASERATASTDRVDA